MYLTDRLEFEIKSKEVPEISPIKELDRENQNDIILRVFASNDKNPSNLPEDKNNPGYLHVSNQLVPDHISLW